MLIAQTSLSALTLLRYRPSRDRLTLPDVCCDLLWLDGRSYIVGPLSHAMQALGAGQDVLVLRLDPQVARYWLGVPLHELTDRVTALELFDQQLAVAIAAQFESGRVSALVGQPARLSVSLAEARVNAARARLRRGHRVGAIALALGVSERQLERLFVDGTGLTPRMYRRILRARRAIMAAGRGLPLVDAAAECGFADQAHFTREVRDLTGHSPRSLLSHVGKLQDVAAGTL